MRISRSTLVLTTSTLFASLTMMGCETKTQTGALVGGSAGAASGAVIAGPVGAVVGGAGGAVTGALIGSEEDKKDQAQE
ncbi:MAG: glycine zipper domain-containing protein [Phycisphaerales bacterium]|nr:glycine zipper domain-containing protein [Phycisphaerales bacterium]